MANRNSGGPVPKPVELPTDYNVQSSSPQPSFPSDNTHPNFNSPVSPAVSPTPDMQQQHDTRPPHHRNPSSVSSAGVGISRSHGDAGTEPQQRPRYVSGFTEEFNSPGMESGSQPTGTGSSQGHT